MTKSYVIGKNTYTEYELKELPGMTKVKQDLICSREMKEGVNKLIADGVTIEQLARSNENCLTLALAIPDTAHFASRLLTYNHILGIDDIPKAIPEKSNTVKGPDVVEHQGLKLKAVGKEDLNVTHIYYVQNKQNKFASIKRGKINEVMTKEHIALIKDGTPITLLHDWNVLAIKDDKNNEFHYYCCQEINYVDSLCCQPGFPLNDCKKYSMLNLHKFFNEEKFIALLTKYKTSVEKLKNDGFTMEQLDFLCANHAYINEFLLKGFTFNDIKNIDQKRLEFIFDNINDINSALQFVSLDSLCNISYPTVVSHLYGKNKMFNLAPPPEDTEEDNNKLVNNKRGKCMIL